MVSFELPEKDEGRERPKKTRRAKRETMSKIKNEMSWRDLKGLTFEEIDALEQKQEARRLAEERGEDPDAPPVKAGGGCFGCCGGDGAAPAAPAADAEAPAEPEREDGDDEFADANDGEGGAETETWSEDDSSVSSSDSEDDCGGDRTPTGGGSTAGEWWHTALTGITQGFGGVVESVKKAAKDMVKEKGETLISDLLDKFFLQQRRNNTMDPLMPEWFRWRSQAVWDNIIPDVKLEIMHLLTNVEARMGLVALRRGSALAMKLDEEMDLMPHGFWQRKRAFLLYKMSPYDRSFWERMRDPWHWIITCVKALPATQAVSFALYLGMMDKKDDFQLNEFIMQAKGFQFLTSGCLSMVYYSLRLVSCTLLVTPDSAKECHSIYRGSINSVIGVLGGEAPWIIDLVSYVLTIAANIFLSWIALSLMDKSVPKGAEQRRGDDLIGQVVAWKERGPAPVEAAEPPAANPPGSPGGARPGLGARAKTERALTTIINIPSKMRFGKTWGSHKGLVVAYDAEGDFHSLEVATADGLTATRAVALHKLPYIMLRPFGKNHLKNLLYWDAGCAIFCFLFFAAALFFNAKMNALEDWQIMGVLFWYRTVYSLTTIPFLLARIPVVDKVLGHHRPTAYTRYGKCVPKRKIWPWYPMPPAPRDPAPSFAESGSPKTPKAGLA